MSQASIVSDHVIGLSPPLSLSCNGLAVHLGCRSMPLPGMWACSCHGRDKKKRDFLPSLSPLPLALFSATVFVSLRLVANQAPPCWIRIRRGSRFRMAKQAWRGSLASCGSTATKGDKVVVVFVEEYQAPPLALSCDGQTWRGGRLGQGRRTCKPHTCVSVCAPC